MNEFKNKLRRLREGAGKVKDKIKTGVGTFIDNAAGKEMEEHRKNRDRKMQEDNMANFGSRVMSARKKVKY